MTYYKHSKRQFLRDVISLTAIFVGLIAIASSALAQKIAQSPAQINQGRAFGQRAGSGNDPIVPPLPFFLPTVTYDAGAGQARSLAVTDLNHDGLLDVAVATASGVGVLLGNGDGTLRTSVLYDSGGISPLDVKVADVNRDGKKDIVVLNECGAPNCQFWSIGVLLGNGDGTFQPAMTYDGGPLPPGKIAAADVNRDGKPDLIVTLPYPSGFENPGAVAVLLGNGDGTFQSAVTYASGGFLANGVAVADLNGDKKKDIIVTNQCSQYCSAERGEGFVGVLLGNGDGTFQPVVTYDPAADNSGSVLVADVNGDGKSDLLVAAWLPNEMNTDWNGVSVLLGNGDGTFQPAVAYIGTQSSYAPSALAVADVNKDGHLDVAVAGFSQAGSLFLGNGNGTFQAGQPAGLNTDIGGMVFADMNGDGRPDLVAADYGVGIDVQLHVGDTVTTTSLSSTPNPAVFGQETFTATISSGSGVPTGNVIFYNEAYGISGLVPLVNGKAKLSGVGSDVGVGTSPIAAVYQGSVIYHPSLSNVVNQVITPATTTTTVTPSKNPRLVNTTVVYTVTVSSKYLGPFATSVTCTDNGTTMSPEKKNPMLFAKKYSTAGTHAIVCMFAGDGNNYSSTSPTLNERIVYPTTTVLTTSGSPSHVGQPVTFTATVSSPYGAIPDGEMVAFTYGTKKLGTAPLSHGTAALTTSSLPEGTFTVKGTYQGDATFITTYGKISQEIDP